MPANLKNSAVATGQEKGEFSFQSPKKTMPKNIQIIIHLHSFHMLARLCTKFFKLRFSSTWTKNFQVCNLDLEKAEEPEIKLPTVSGSQKKQGISRKTSTSASLTVLKPLTVWITTNCGKFFKRWECQTTLSVPDKPVCRSRSSSYNWTWKNGLVENLESGTTRLNIVTLLI